MTLSENDKHQLRVEVAKGLAAAGERLVRGEVNSNTMEFLVDIIKPDLDKHDGDLIAAVTAGDVLPMKPYFVSILLPEGLI